MQLREDRSVERPPVNRSSALIPDRLVLGATCNTVSHSTGERRWKSFTWRERERERDWHACISSNYVLHRSRCVTDFSTSYNNDESRRRVSRLRPLRGMRTGCRLTGWRQTTHVNGVTMITLSGHELSLRAFSSPSSIPSRISMGDNWRISC